MPFLIQPESVTILIPQRPKQIIKLKLEISNFQFLSHLLRFIFYLLLQEGEEKKQIGTRGKCSSLGASIPCAQR